MYFQPAVSSAVNSIDIKEGHEHALLILRSRQIAAIRKSRPVSMRVPPCGVGDNDEERERLLLRSNLKSSRQLFYS